GASTQGVPLGTGRSRPRWGDLAPARGPRAGLVPVLARSRFVAVRIRFRRVGRNNRPCFRLVATDVRAPQDGRHLATLGPYDRLGKDEAKAFTIDEERVRYGIGVGARPTHSAELFLRRRGILLPAPTRERKRRRNRERGHSRRVAAGAASGAAKPAA